MRSFPLPVPISQPEPQPAVDLGGAVVTFRCASEVAPFANPVIARFRQHHEAGQMEDGLRTVVGFSQWRLRQDGEAQFAITTSDYAGGDLVDGATDDLTLALWIEASQADATSRAHVGGEDVDLAQGVTLTQAALTVLEKGREDELVLARRSPGSAEDSGWLVRTAKKSYLREKEVEVLAGLLVETAAHLVPLLALPPGTVARVAGGRFCGAWWTRAADGTVADADHQLLDAEGHGAGTTPSERGSAPALETVERVVDGVTLRARAHPDLVPPAKGVLAAFAAGQAGPARAGARLQSMYAPFALEEGEGGALLVTAPDFSSPQAYREGSTDDLTQALVAEVGQTQTARRAGLAPHPVLATETIAIQQAALRDIELGRPSAYVMERFALDPGSEVLADGTRRSGWCISTPSAQTEVGRTLLHVDAGELQARSDMFTPYYGLPEGSLLQFAGGHVHAAHLVDHAKLDEAVARNPHRRMGDLLASGEASRPLFDIP